MDKVTVYLRVPALDASYEILIPIGLKVRQVIALLIELVQDLSARQYAPSGTEILCRSDSGCVLSNDNTLEDYCIRNGEELVLL